MIQILTRFWAYSGDTLGIFDWWFQVWDDPMTSMLFRGAETTDHMQWGYAGDILGFINELMLHIGLSGDG